MKRFWIALCASFLLAGCGAMRVDTRGLTLQSQVDLERFSGRWFVIANIPYFAERDKVGTYVEYAVNDDGTLADYYYFRKKNFAAPLDRWEGKAWVMEGTGNAVWKTQFLWPFKVDFVILYVDSDYQLAVIGHPERELGWIFARAPNISDEDYQRLLSVLADAGYDTQKLKKVPQDRTQLGQPGFQ
jgi:apolipoprotein D and lipocalin family protein